MSEVTPEAIPSPEPAKLSEGPARPVYLVTFMDTPEVQVVERDNVHFKDSWAVFSNGREYVVPTDVVAIPAHRVSRVEQIMSRENDELPPHVAPTTPAPSGLDRAQEDMLEAQGALTGEDER